MEILGQSIHGCEPPKFAIGETLFYSAREYELANEQLIPALECRIISIQISVNISIFGSSAKYKYEIEFPGTLDSNILVDENKLFESKSEAAEKIIEVMRIRRNQLASMLDLVVSRISETEKLLENEAD